ncbi:MAG: hypothetical protein ABI461_10415 [Polyangiaceae bacterium]
MPLLRPRCPHCTKPLGDPPPVPITAPCIACGLSNVVVVSADGQPAAFDVAFTPMRLLQWIRAARTAMSRGTPGVAIGACVRCSSPVVLSSRMELSLPCPHCKEPVRGTAATLLVDQWPEPWARVEGGENSLEYRVAVIDDRADPTAGCATCGAPSPAQDPSDRCRRCGGCIWVVREADHDGDGAAEKRRIQLGVRVDGARQGRPADTLVSLAQGEAMLRQDDALANNVASGKSTEAIFGVGCAVLIAVTILASAIGYAACK